MSANDSHVGILDFAVGGIDFAVPGNGGMECAAYLSNTQRLVESVLFLLFAAGLIWCGYSKLKLPPLRDDALNREMDYWGKRIMLFSMCLTFGIELGYKFASKTMIFVVYPCHVATSIQIFLLAVPPKRYVTGIFRLQLYILNGAPLAIIFPVTDTRILPFEVELYYIQHILMLIVPLYLLRMGGVYIPEKLNDFSWSLVALGILFIYHFIPLQIGALISHVNLNNMLCPAISDPFHGQFYRLCGSAHQILLIPLQGKIYALIAQYFDIQPKHDYGMEEYWFVKSTTNEKTANEKSSSHVKQN
ncbi:transmembrane protein 164 [Patella vulgata]|uniref:transmembrane protein 164 n=1 Tax=Patella vulgata TaxID=6465 RepID=UPI0024A7FB8A|nr:transmembrane protein 164 [Patella vulgata]